MVELSGIKKVACVLCRKADRSSRMGGDRTTLTVAPVARGRRRHAGSIIRIEIAGRAKAGCRGAALLQRRERAVEPVAATTARASRVDVHAHRIARVVALGAGRRRNLQRGDRDDGQEQGTHWKFLESAATAGRRAGYAIMRRRWRPFRNIPLPLLTHVRKNRQADLFDLQKAHICRKPCSTKVASALRRIPFASPLEGATLGLITPAPDHRSSGAINKQTG